ncbi:hypothetical protein B0H17DRAFT_1205971 [Mycena rosella]|uniref:Uncharacterized protein n=1 Tax=Mycena rosella TaxID=1033263 RepID=A0AAD7D9Q8_MYCRO|nr:hypothetical protein B0H17DRAFT_1205971 [Mycena rosella]
MGGLADAARLLPQDGGALAMAILPPDAWRCSVTFKTAPGTARATVDEGPIPGADPWATALSSSGASLALAFATGNLGSSPGSSRTPILMGDGLALSAILAFWLHALLLAACAVAFFTTSKRVPPTLRPLAGVRMLAPPFPTFEQLDAEAVLLS